MHVNWKHSHIIKDTEPASEAREQRKEDEHKRNNKATSVSTQCCFVSASFNDMKQQSNFQFTNEISQRI